MQSKQYSLIFFVLGLMVYWWMPKNVLTVKDQSVGTTLRVDRVSLARDGYVVVTKDSLNFQESDSLIGVSDYLPAGTYSNLSIALDLDAILATDSGRELFVSLVYDTGDKDFGELDMPVQRMFGGAHQRQVTLL